jgi:N-methylhydantoinase A
LAGSNDARLAVDIGGTFTDIALEHGSKRFSKKVLTTPRAPELGAMEGIGAVLADAGLRPADVSILIHGTTLATNALIERKGAITALITTEGFRDTIEMAFENRFEQYDVYMDRPAPLVPRHRRYTVAERFSARGQIITPLDETGVRAVIEKLDSAKAESVAVCFLHSYLRPEHELRVRDILAKERPDLSVSVSCEVSPEIREYERFSTTCANAYIQPLMSRYLARFDRLLRDGGFGCPLFLMTSGGGLTTLENAMHLPVRLVESGPAGGAILARQIAAECGAEEVLSFDMGGTTAKICLIDGYEPQRSRNFEVAREFRNLKGSGLPLRIPVIEMVEIGAGGGSIARIDRLDRITVGPDSAGSEPGPACYGRGGQNPTVTDADVVMQRIDPARFAGGKVKLEPARATAAVDTAIGKPMGMESALAAFAISEIIDEGMANAARVHAIERGKVVSRRTMIAFGGAAPLHTARLAQRLGIDRVIVPTGAGVGSAIGFLRAPISFEVVRSRYERFGSFRLDDFNALLRAMESEATTVVRAGAPKASLVCHRTADLRYVGQGHEITVTLPPGDLDPSKLEQLRTNFEKVYLEHYGRIVPGLDVEAINWMVTVSTPFGIPARLAEPAESRRPKASASRPVFDADQSTFCDYAIHRRPDLRPGDKITGPAIIVEDETSTLVPPAFDVHMNALGYLVLERRGSEGAAA